MERTYILMVIACVLLSCNEQKNYEVFGATIEADNSVEASKMNDKYASLEVGDTLETKFTATVNSVCPKKGCWMKLDLENGKEAMVRFKDYGFFVPKDIQGKQVIVSGKAFIDQMSVEDQKHFAEDAGKSEEEIAAISKPSVTYSFMADGVLIEE
ncbi:DUF4920 domain-containing protein [Galbibacter sp. EGI 63066]|uniref:DUF4920 domain-containing protein n=1 Tax=Galbibacter sp. EGI 63066 TaxID=2993559 RepID=UPI002248FC25|nr:DUF4920 domain-containing protein [Galbibacter sp. EGI 63066]MCX2678559.1 DUF4920 domain-containing protein [Galbibacter sp. EGI 63066]